jgi:hypothetical protein
MVAFVSARAEAGFPLSSMASSNLPTSGSAPSLPAAVTSQVAQTFRGSCPWLAVDLTVNVRDTHSHQTHQLRTPVLLCRAILNLEGSAFEGTSEQSVARGPTVPGGNDPLWWKLRWTQARQAAELRQQQKQTSISSDPSAACTPPATATPQNENEQTQPTPAVPVGLWRTTPPA